MYGVRDYLAMVDDPVRTHAYLEALRATIRPGDVVLELGTGFGYFAVQACRLGAAHVHAIEPNDAIALGPALAAANGCADRITFHQAYSQRVTLERPADVLIEDLRGVSPLHTGRFDALADARRRLLRPDARRIPRRDHLWCAPSGWPPVVAGATPFAPEENRGIDIGVARAAARSSIVRSSGGADALLAPGRRWATLDLAADPPSLVEGAVTVTTERSGRIDAIASWFSTELAEGVGFDSAPASPPTIYGHGLLPLATPVTVHGGDEVTIHLRAAFDGAEHVWAWELHHRSAQAAPQTVRGSTVGEGVLSASRLARRAARHRPPRTAAIERLATLLGAVDGTITLEGLAERMRQSDPARFRDDRDALRWVGDQLAAVDQADGP